LFQSKKTSWAIIGDVARREKKKRKAKKDERGKEIRSAPNNNSNEICDPPTIHR
jgi:hypothetical protein